MTETKPAFQPGDIVRCVRSYGYLLYGSLYTIQDTGDYGCNGVLVALGNDYINHYPADWFELLERPEPKTNRQQIDEYAKHIPPADELETIARTSEEWLRHEQQIAAECDALTNQELGMVAECSHSRQRPSIAYEITKASQGHIAISEAEALLARHESEQVAALKVQCENHETNIAAWREKVAELESELTKLPTVSADLFKSDMNAIADMLEREGL